MNRERGASLAIVALLLVVLLVVTALVVDIAYAKQERRGTQNAADAAALAAAQELDGHSGQITRAVARAVEYAGLNLSGLTPADWAGCSDPDALTYVPSGQVSAGCISFDSATEPTRIRVRVPERAPAFFGAFLGHDSYEVSSAATAARAQTTTTGGAPAGPCGLCIISPGRLQANINGTNATTGQANRIHVTGGEIYGHCLTVNSNDNVPASSYSPLPLRYVGSCNNSNWGRNVQPAPSTFESRYAPVASVPNPFEDVTVSYTTPIPADTQSNLSWCNGTWSQAKALQPDVMYTQTVNIGCGGTLTLAPGTYYFRGNLQVSGNTTVIGNGVTLVFGCASGSAARPCTNEEGGKFNFANESTVDITAPTSASAATPYPRFAILFDPGNRSGTPNQLAGNTTLEGAVYAKQAGFSMGSQNGVVRAWTVVAGGNFDANNGTILIDNTKLGGNSATTAPQDLGTSGAISLVG